TRNQSRQVYYKTNFRKRHGDKLDKFSTKQTFERDTETSWTNSVQSKLSKETRIQAEQIQYKANIRKRHGDKLDKF
ncbi:hypothetical protein ACJMK2_024686, partial [Sinanodonta woodiana]